MLSINKHSHFQLISKHGIKFLTKSVAVIGINSSTINSLNSKDSYYVGLRVTKRIGSAVTRNLIKRRLRHIIREIAKNNKDLVALKAYLIIPRISINQLVFADLQQEIIKAIKFIFRRLSNQSYKEP